MTTQVPVEDYKVYQWTPDTARRLEHTVTIDLYYSRRQIGTINFYPAKSPRTLNDKIYAQSKGFIIYLEYYEDRYPQILDLLRNESVEICITAAPGTPGSFTNGEGSVRTAREPAGEGEN